MENCALQIRVPTAPVPLPAVPGSHRVRFSARPRARPQFAGVGSKMALPVDGDPTRQNSVVDNLRLITSAMSLGYDESLIVRVSTRGRAESRTTPNPFQKCGHFRISVGTENADELITDVAARSMRLPHALPTR
ncbi:PLP-dependent transferase [Saccharopolyspora pogona]|uniref:PLP-dependent transferase n=1 Tax=Saccharopolyspora pogona TaxID=333966 RepID=UPI001681D60F|nr:PLP-dependent transferase [Saccharopolyspora pogona]